MEFLNDRYTRQYTRKKLWHRFIYCPLFGHTPVYMTAKYGKIIRCQCRCEKRFIKDTETNMIIPEFILGGN